MPPAEFYLTRYNLQVIVAGLKQKLPSVEISPDLNLSRISLPLNDKTVDLGGCFLTLEDLNKLSRKFDSIILFKSGRSEKLEFFCGHFYKLRPTPSAPTVEIDGVQMHRTKNIEPWEDSRRKASHAVKPGDAVLDTCGGLGYTALWAIKLGASSVVTCEKNENIVKIRQFNPYSQGLINQDITILCGDIGQIIGGFPAENFTSIIHDPPRFSLAGELYGQAFYDQLNRVLKPQGRLFHYTGAPYSKGRGRSFLPGIYSRLEQAGFRVFPQPQDLGVLGKKFGLPNGTLS